ncbi:hypothetical protein HK101_006634, partial [Irineochytrium annulatum]
IIPKVWNASDRREVPIELQLDDGTDLATRVTLVECALLQRLRHRDAPINGGQPTGSVIPATVTGTVGHPVKARPPVLGPSATTTFLRMAVPMTAMQPDAECDPFLLEHVIQVTVHLQRPLIMTVKKCTFYLPLKVVVAADEEDRVLNNLPSPVGWFVRPDEARKRSSIMGVSAGAGGSMVGAPAPSI